MSTDTITLSTTTRSQIVPRVAAVVGILAFGAGLVWAPQRAWATLLTVSFQLIGVGVGAVFFISAMYCSGAGWGVALRRVPEAMTAALPIGAIGLGIVLLARPSLYPWTDPSPELAEMLVGFKGIWLNRWFFLVRSAAYLITWIFLARAIVRTSRQQDTDGAFRHTRRNIRLSAIFLGVYAVTFWLAAFDWIMTLEPEWYSSIFGIYNFAGMFLTALAVATLLALWLRRTGPLTGTFTDEHLHDLGKLVFAFSTFWIYIWFSQYMLIWYAHIPEETGYFALRHSGIWGSLALLNLFLNWIVPFIALLSSRAKRDGGTMAKVCGIIVVGRILDTYLLVLPPVVGADGAPGLIELGMLIGGVGAFLIIFHRTFSRAPAVPRQDPLILESLHHHQ